MRRITASCCQSFSPNTATSGCTWLNSLATTVATPSKWPGRKAPHSPSPRPATETVVAKLFNQVQPDVAVFGEKDWQQLAVIRRMARDLDLVRPAAERILGVPTVREADGLAMSSRNRYLSPENRARASALPRLMREVIADITDGGDVVAALTFLRSGLLRGGFESVDYAELADAENLAPLTALRASPARLFVAARIGGTRLIDNMAVDP